MSGLRGPRPVILEYLRRVADDGGDFARTKAYRPTLSDLEAALASALAAVGYEPRKAAAFTIMPAADAVFLGFDGGSPQHASGCWSFEVRGPAPLVAALGRLPVP